MPNPRYMQLGTSRPDDQLARDSACAAALVCIVKYSAGVM